jgi:hypothetical protein
MTNYNERLNDVLERFMFSFTHLDDPMDLKQTKQALTSLIKELVAEAKPYYCDGGEQCRCTTDTDRNMNVGKEIATRKFEQNLLKALEQL